MPTEDVRILCVGNELDLLEVRCAVLEQAGYKARPATTAQAGSVLACERFHLVILSVTLRDEEREPIRLAAGETPVISLRGITFPRDLLHEVEIRLAAGPGITCVPAGQQKKCLSL